MNALLVVGLVLALLFGQVGPFVLNLDPAQPAAAVVLQSAAPAPVRLVAQEGPGILELDKILPRLFGPQIVALLAMIAAQVLLAVALAVRQGVFEWRKLADFYRTMVIPMLIGWVAFAILAKFAGNGVLGPTYGDMAAEGVTGLAWLAVVASLGSKIATTVKELYGELSPFKAKA